MTKILSMKMLLLAAACALCCAACNNGNNTRWPDRAIRDSVRDPSVTQPENENIPADMHIANDSVIVPDSSGAPMRQH
jgi:hypothetical protein